MKLKPFQRDDLSRLALTTGGILSWDTGLGKTIAAYTYPILKSGFEESGGGGLLPSAPWLFVVPGDLHPQFIAEGRDLFRTDVTHIDSQETFKALVHDHDPGGRPLVKKGFYITSYTQLCQNGTSRYPNPKKFEPRALLRHLHLKEQEAAVLFDCRGEYRKWADAYALFGLDPLTATKSGLRDAYDREIKYCYDNKSYMTKLDKAYAMLTMLVTDQPRPSWEDLAEKQQDFVIATYCKDKLDEFMACDGETRDYEVKGQPWPVKCVQSPSLADLCHDTFEGVVIDEGVKMKGDDTLIGKGIRTMNPKYRLVLTATPIKNRLSDVFWLAHWATGGHDGPHARFPYAGHMQDKQAFCETFLVSERNLSKERKAAQEEKRRRYEKLTAQVCNIHRLWKLFGPVTLRRRKDHIGEEIAGKNIHVIRAPMGTEQARTYRYHLHRAYEDKNGLPAEGAKLQALRSVAVAPHSSNLVEKRSSARFIPKIATALRIIQERVALGEQVLVGSALLEGLDTLDGYLREAGIRTVHMDGRVSPKKRGRLSSEFKRGPLPGGVQVGLAGVESCAEGHNFYLCRNLVFIGYSWAYDKFEQFTNRIHRMLSPQDVNIYHVVCEKSIDLKLESSIKEKADASELVLDGKLRAYQPQEVNLAELLETAEREFAKDGATIDETHLAEKEWPKIREQLRAAGSAWERATAGNVVEVESRVEPVVEEKPLTEARRHGEKKETVRQGDNETVEAPEPAVVPRRNVIEIDFIAEAKRILGIHVKEKEKEGNAVVVEREREGVPAPAAVPDPPKRPAMPWRRRFAAMAGA